MKSMKLASGFAVSGLALAIAGSAVAQESTTEVTFSGDLRLETVLDLENETRKHDAPGYGNSSSGGDKEDWYNLSAKWDVTHGPFSGDIVVGLVGGEDWKSGDQADGGDASIEVDNLRVDEGPVSFGDIGRVTDTAGLYEGITANSAFWDDGDENTRMGVNAAFRYTLADLGLRVQAEGDGNGDGNFGGFGFAASINQDLGVAEVWADAQLRQAQVDTDATDGEVAINGMSDDNSMTFGVGAVVAPSDMVTLTAALRNLSVYALSDDVANTLQTANDAYERTAYAVQADLALSDALSAYALYFDTGAGDNQDDDTAHMKAGVEATVDAITVEGSYEAVVAELGQYLINGKVTYATGAYSVFGELALSAEDFGTSAELIGASDEPNATKNDGGTKFVVGGDYTTEAGIVYGAEYENKADSFWDTAAPVSTATAYAQYSF